MLPMIFRRVRARNDAYLHVIRDIASRCNLCHMTGAKTWPLGNGIPLKLSSKEDLPELWSPTTTSWLRVSMYTVIFYCFLFYLRKRHVLTDIQVAELVDLFKQCRA